MDGVELAVAEVPSGLPHLYSLRGAYLTRTQRQNRPLTTPELRRLLLERGEAGFEEQILPGAALADLDERMVEDYLEHMELPPD